MREKFKAAGRFFYNRRDTLGYAVVFGVAALTAATASPYAPSIQSTAVSFSIAREIIRSVAWSRHAKKPHLAGLSKKTVVDSKSFSKSALFMMCTINGFRSLEIAYMCQSPSTSVIAGANLLVAAKLYHELGGAKKILKNYKTMWNYHENDDDEGGLAQGVKKTAPPLKDGIISQVPVFGMGRGVSLNGPR